MNSMTASTEDDRKPSLTVAMGMQTIKELKTVIVVSLIFYYYYETKWYFHPLRVQFVIGHRTRKLSRTDDWKNAISSICLLMRK